jgi:hypothetical protein
MRHLVYIVNFSVVQINSLMLNITLQSSVITSLVYNNTKYVVPFMTLEPSLPLFVLCCAVYHIHNFGNTTSRIRLRKMPSFNIVYEFSIRIARKISFFSSIKYVTDFTSTTVLS